MLITLAAVYVYHYKQLSEQRSQWSRGKIGMPPHSIDYLKPALMSVLADIDMLSWLLLSRPEPKVPFSVRQGRTWGLKEPGGVQTPVSASDDVNSCCHASCWYFRCGLRLDEYEDDFQEHMSRFVHWNHLIKLFQLINVSSWITNTESSKK